MRDGGFFAAVAIVPRPPGAPSWSFGKGLLWKALALLWACGYATFYWSAWDRIAGDATGAEGSGAVGNLLHLGGTFSGFPSKPQPTVPHRLVFTYKEDLLLPRNLYRRDATGDLARNVNRTIAMYREAWNNDPNMEVDFLLDSDCLRVVNESEPRLAAAFAGEEWGPHKSDLCRVAALWDKGGYYHDNDMVVVNVPYLASRVNFATVYESSLQAFFQAFMAVAPHHPVIREALDVFLELYSGRQTFPHNFGTHVTRQAFAQYVEKQKKTVKEKRKERAGRDAPVSGTATDGLADTVKFLHERCLADHPRLFPEYPRHGPDCHPHNNVVIDLESNEVLFESRLTSDVAQRYNIGRHGRGY